MFPIYLTTQKPDTEIEGLVTTNITRYDYRPLLHRITVSLNVNDIECTHTHTHTRRRLNHFLMGSQSNHIISLLLMEKKH